MTSVIEVDVWVRGAEHANTHPILSLPSDPTTWRDDDVRRLLTEMLLSLERERNPGGEPPAVSLRGFSWVVSPYEGGVVLHLEMQSGTASAGPIAIDEAQLTTMVTKAIKGQDAPTERVH
ncbi:MAG TPA: hypothetical protein VNJ02_18250 [Vicinamibacterales bacterium]|nr:hypothetical protein [Vicinamibacterales bacterium]